MKFLARPATLTAAALLLGLAATSAYAVGTPDPATTTTTTPGTSTTTTTTTTDEKKDATKPADATTKPDEKKPEDKKSEAPLSRQQAAQNFLEGYRHAHALVQKGEYEAAIAALRALHQDTHPDVANYLGYSSRKLGRYDDAKYWYETALVSDPGHTRTWQYYGLWHLEQGNRLKAEEHLEKIRLICGGPACDDYRSLKDAINSGKASY